MKWSRLFSWRLRSTLRVARSRRRAPARVFPRLGVEILEDRTLMSVITVMNLNDSGPGSLRDAIGAAANGDTINFASNVRGTIPLQNVLLILHDITITGPGAGLLTLSGSNSVAVFGIDAGNTVGISGLTIANARSVSGAIDINNNSHVTLANDVISQNVGTVAAGGINNLATLILDHSVVANNHGLDGGGVLDGDNASLTVLNSTVANNQADHTGGGICLTPNAALRLTNVTVAGNQAGNSGGGVFISDGPRSVNVLNSIIAKNTASTDPDYSASASTAAATTIANTFLGLYTSNIGLMDGTNGNIIGTGTPRDPLLGALQNNGGPTPTLALLANSPAIDRGRDDSSTGSTDQRGFNRKVGAQIDMGAYEYQPPATTTTLTSSANPAAFGQMVTFTATVAGQATNSNPPTGMVNFVIDGGMPVAEMLDATGKATLSRSDLTVGTHTVVVNYLGDRVGDMTFAASTSNNLTQTVNKDSTTTTLTSSLNPSTVNQAVTFTATVTGTGTSQFPTGMVTFLDGTTTLGTGTLSMGHATFMTSTLPAGAHTITARYEGDANFTTSTSGPLTQTVNKGSTTTTLTSSANPSTFGQAVTFTATVTTTATGTLVPGGTVTFLEGTTTLGTGTLSMGHATFMTSALPAGAHTITARYEGDVNFTTSTSPGLAQTVNKAGTTTTLASSLNPSTVNQAVTFTATVAGMGTTQNPTGTVTFLEGTTVLGTGTLSMGHATFMTSTLPAGAHMVTARYEGDANFTTSTSSALTQTVNKGSTTTTLASSANPSTFGQAVTFTATVATTATGTIVPGGTVTFLDGTTTLGAVALSMGRATFVTSTLAIGAHMITARYDGDTNFTTSTSSALTQTVNKAGTTTTLTSSLNPSTVNQMVTFTATVTGMGTTQNPTGMVTFLEGTTTLGTGTLSMGRATFTTSTLPAGTHIVTARYEGDANFTISTSTALTQTVNKGPTTTTLTSSANPSTFGQAIIFTATVTTTATGTLVPGGTVTFLEGTTPLGTGTLSSGHATFMTSTLGAGTHMITARYEGDVNFTTSTSGALTQTVNKDGTTTTLVSNLNPSTVNQAVTFTATVTGTGTTQNPTGMVTFLDGTAVIGTGTLSGGRATLMTSLLNAGAHTVTARYEGDANFTTSTSMGLSQTVNKGSTTTTLTSDPNPSGQGQTVTFTATITPSVAGPLTPTGTVTFLEGTTTLGTGTLSMGHATFMTSTLALGNHTITARYEGDANFTTSTSGALTQTVRQGSTTTTLASTPNPSNINQAVTFTATVTGTGSTQQPGGTVTFMEGSTVLGTGTLSMGHATFMTSTLSGGAHMITARYGGDANFGASTSTAVTQTVNKASTTTTLASSVNPSTFGQAVTFTATVSTTATGMLTPGGTVTFLDGTAVIGTGTLSMGHATLMISTLTAGNHMITARYEGDTNFITSTSTVFTQTVNQAGTTTTLASTPNPSTINQMVTFTATVTGTGTSQFPTGMVMFLEGTTVLGTGTLSMGRATFMTATLPAGAHMITAHYAGDANFTASTSGALTQTVNKGPTTTTLTSSANPSTFGQAVTFTATVSTTATGTLVPGGTVTFLDGTTTLGTGTVSMGHATFMTSTLGAGTHMITARYEGDVNFTTSTSGALTQTVNKDGTTTTLVSSANPSTVNQAVTFTATVTGTGTTQNPTGMVTFLDGTAVIGTGTLSMGHATFTTSALGGGTHTVTARYEGDANFTTSTSGALTQTVDKGATTTTLTSAPNPSGQGQAVTFTATVTTTATGSLVPTGTVTFLEGTTTLGTGTLSNGMAMFTISTLTAGAHTITARYEGNTNFNSSTSSGHTQTVNQFSSMTTLDSTPNPSNINQAVTFTATVTGVGTSQVPTGMVTFLEGTTVLGTGTLSMGHATFMTSTLGAGTHMVTAQYGGDGSFGASTSAAHTQTVNKAGTTTVLDSMPNPSVFGQTVTLTATVSTTATGTLVPTGTVTFLEGTTVLGTGTVSMGHATFTISTLTVGAHSLTARYEGDANFTTSTSGAHSQSVNQAMTTTMLDSTPNPSVFGQTVTFTATVTGVGTSQVPTGTVTFLEGTTTLGTGTLTNGRATFTTTTLSVGTHTITARYEATTNFASSTSAPHNQVVNQVGTTATTTALTNSPNPSTVNQTVTFTATVTTSGTGQPTGTVAFMEGTTLLGIAALSAGHATFTTAALTAATHMITARYEGDTTFAPSTSTPQSQVVNKDSTTTTLDSSPNPSGQGQAVIFTATVAAGMAGPLAPTGTVTFLEGTTVLGTGTLNNGVATFMTTTLTVGTHTITARYEGDTNFTTSTSSGHTQTVNQFVSMTTLTGSPNPSNINQAVTFTATVTGVGTSQVPTGMVTFLDGTTVLGTGTLTNGMATFTTSTLTSGAHMITARYGGDTNFGASTSTVFDQTVNQGTTTTTLASSPNPSTFGQAVTLTATVSTTAAGMLVPGGTVTFLEGTTVLGTGTLSNGMATLTISTLTAGTHTITARYEGDVNFTGSTSTAVTQTVNKTGTTTTLMSSLNPSGMGQMVTFTATVTGTGTTQFPTGTVTFLDGTTVLGTGTLSMGHATFTTSTLTVGAHMITARYDGDANFNTSTSGVLTQTVNQFNSTVTMTSTPNPSTVNQAVTLTATVTGVGTTQTPTGMVTFRDGTTVLGTATLTNGTATLTVSNLTAGTHMLTVSYAGDNNFGAGTSAPITQAVNQGTTAIALTSTPNPSGQGQAVTFTATVTPGIGGTLVPTGTVTFLDGTTILGTGTLTNGVATFTTSTLTIGNHSITARYQGDTNFAASTSAAITQTVTAFTSVTTLVSSPNPSAVNQAVTLTATVTVTGTTQAPTGMVTFLDGTTVLGSSVLSNGTATLMVTSLTAGTHSLTARYGGDTNFGASTSAVITQTVNKTNTTTLLTSMPNPPRAGQPLTLTATITPATTGLLGPTGTVTFMDGTTVLGTGTLTNGVATFTVSTLSAGPHSFSANYSGDTNFNASSGTLANNVLPGTTTALASSANPARSGATVTFTATVSAGGVNPGPTGTVTFMDGTTVLGTGTLVNGVATFSTSALTLGRHTITASYGGDTNFAGSTSNTVTEAIISGTFFAVGGAPGRVQVRRTSDGSLVADFAPFGTSYTGGVNVALGDINGDGFEDLVVGAAGAPHVKVYNGSAFSNGTFNQANPDASLLASFMAYDPVFKTGVNVAVGYVSGNGFADLITGAMAGNPHVKVYSGLTIANGTFTANPEGTLLASFFAYGINQDIGVNVAAGDVTRSGFADVITGSTVNGGQVKVYNGQVISHGNFLNPEGNLRTQFSAFPGLSIGAFVAAGDTTGQGFADIIVGAGGGFAHVKVYSGSAVANNTFQSGSPDSNLLDQFFAYDTRTQTGVTVGAADFEGTGRYDILTGATASPHFRVIRANSSGVMPPAVNGIDNTASDIQGGIAVAG